MRKACSVSLAAGLVNQRSPSANLTGARKGYVATKLQTEHGFGRLNHGYLAVKGIIPLQSHNNNTNDSSCVTSNS